MKRHKDLIAVLKSNEMRITPVRRVLLQYILDNQERDLSLKEIQNVLIKKIVGVDRSSVYRNLEVLKKLDILQEYKVQGKGKRFQYVFDQKIHHYYICKVCGKLRSGGKTLFTKIERALEHVPGFLRSDLTAVFYGYCSKCK